MPSIIDYGYSQQNRKDIFNITEQIDNTDQIFPDLSLSNSKIDSIYVSKLRAGSLKIDEYLQSTGFVAGVSGWRITGDGSAQFKDISLVGGTFTGPTIQTATSGVRTVITGNDIYFFDDTTGGTDPITGDSATIFYPRTDDETQRFIMRKRAGINYDDENVMEMFFDKAANNGKENFLFIGRAGDQDIDEIKLDVITLNAKEIYQFSHYNGVAPVFAISKTDYSGAVSIGFFGMGVSGGTRQYFNFQDMGTPMVFTGSPDFDVGLTPIIGSSSGAYCYVNTKTDANNFVVSFIDGNFQIGETVTQGAKSGLLSSITSREVNIITGDGGGFMSFGMNSYIDGVDYGTFQLWFDAYNIWVEDDILPYTDGTRSLGSSAHRFLKGWFTNLEITNTPTVNGTSLASIYAGIAQTMYIGTTAVAINRGSATLNLAGIGTLSCGAITSSAASSISSASAVPLSLYRTSDYLNAIAGPLTVEHVSTGNMTDGFGVAVRFYIKDTAAVDNYIAQIGAVRSGADNTGDIVFSPCTTGTANEKLRIASTGAATFAGAVSGITTLGCGAITSTALLTSQLSGGYNAYFDDTTAMAANVGGGILLRGKYTAAGAYTGFGYIKAGKLNATEAEVSGYLSLYSRAASGGYFEGIRINSNQTSTFAASLFIKEQASAGTDVAAYGQLWVKSDTPNTLWFTDDAGNDKRIIHSKNMVFTYAGYLYAEDDFAPTIFPYDAFTITKIKAYVKTAPSGGSVVIDINKNGALLDQVTIADGQSSGEETGLSYSIAATDLFTLDINSATGDASDLTVIIYLS